MSDIKAGDHVVWNDGVQEISVRVVHRGRDAVGVYCRIEYTCADGTVAHDRVHPSLLRRATPPAPKRPPLQAESQVMTSKPTPQQVMEMIVKAFRTQVAAAAEGKAIADAGLAKALDELIVSTAANVAQPICWAFETDED